MVPGPTAAITTSKHSGNRRRWQWYPLPEFSRANNLQLLNELMPILLLKLAFALLELQRFRSQEYINQILKMASWALRQVGVSLALQKGVATTQLQNAVTKKYSPVLPDLFSSLVSLAHMDVCRHTYMYVHIY